MSTSSSKSSKSSSGSSSSSSSSSSATSERRSSKPSPFDETALKERLATLKLTRLSSALVLDPNVDTKHAGIVFDERPEVQIEATESSKTGFIEGAAFDGARWSLAGGKPEKQTLGSGAGAPSRSTYTFNLSSSASSRWTSQAGTYKFYFDVGTADASTAKPITVGVARTVYRTPNASEPDERTGADYYHSRQDRSFVLGFDLDPMNQTFSVSFQLGEDGDPQAEDANSTYVKIVERLYHEGPKAEPGSAYEVTDHTLGDGRVYLVCDISDFSAVDTPVLITVTIQPNSPSSKIASVYDYVHQVNAVDSGIGVNESPFGAES